MHSITPLAALILLAPALLEGQQPAMPSAAAAPWGPATAAAGAPTLDAYFAGPAPADRARIAEQILAAGVDFDRLWSGLRAGPAHGDAVPRGHLEPTIEGTDGHLHRYTLLVPETYDAARRYPVRVYLHGATHYPNRGPGGSWWPELELVTSEEYISVLPLAWDESLWWENGQVEALRHILTEVERVFNVDENRVYLLGVSDGGAGVYFSATHNPTPWAAFVPMIGNPQVLDNPSYRVDGHTYAPNLRRRPLFIVNTREDPVHPPSAVGPFLRRYEEVGVAFEYHELHGGHDLSWWSSLSPDLDAFLDAHPRDPYPDTLEWVTDRVDRYNRVRWVIVDELGSAGSGPEARRLQSFARDGRAGAVRAIHDGNAFDVETRGVRRLRLLISPDEVDFGRPVRVTVNGAVVFEDRVEPDPAVLLRWSLVDFDRTMLFAAELDVDVPR